MGGGPRTSQALRKAQAAFTLLGASPRPVIFRRLHAPSSEPPLAENPFVLAAPSYVLPRAVVAAAAAAAAGCGVCEGAGRAASTSRPVFGGDGRETSECASDNGCGGEKESDELECAGLAGRPLVP